MAREDSLWSGVACFDPTKLKGDFLAAGGIVAGLRKSKFDVSLNFFPSNTWHYHLLPWAAGIRDRFGFKYHVSPPSKLPMLINRALPVDENLHDVRQNINLAGFFLGKNTNGAAVRFPTLFSDSDRQWAADHLRSLSGKRLRIGVHPGSSIDHGMSAKRWHPRKFAALTDLLCRFLNADAFVFGGADEEGVKRGVASSMQCVCHVVSPQSLSLTSAMLAQCSLCLCNDSGLMHIAACQGVPTVGIFGPTDEKRNGPFGVKTLVIRKPLAGFPVWTARNVGDRRLPRGINPADGMDLLQVDYAWAQLRPWIEKTFNAAIAPGTE